MNQGAPEHDPLTAEIIGAAIEIPPGTGPGLLESAYEECLAFRALTDRGLGFRRQVDLPVSFRGAAAPVGYRLDFVVAERVVVELKAVEKLIPVHEAQLLTYSRLSGFRIGLLINFNVPVLKDGIKRRAL